MMSRRDPCGEVSSRWSELSGAGGRDGTFRNAHFALAPGIPPVDELLDQNFVQPVYYQLGSEYATLDRLLQSDLLGRKRPAGQFDAGPLVGLPLDDSAIKVDPRQSQR